MPKLRALFLDIDDTLYSTSEFAAAARRAALEAMIAHGLAMSIDDAVKKLTAPSTPPADTVFSSRTCNTEMTLERPELR